MRPRSWSIVLPVYPSLPVGGRGVFQQISTSTSSTGGLSSVPERTPCVSYGRVPVLHSLVSIFVVFNRTTKRSDVRQRSTLSPLPSSTWLRDTFCRRVSCLVPPVHTCHLYVPTWLLEIVSTLVLVNVCDRVFSTKPSGADLNSVNWTKILPLPPPQRIYISKYKKRKSNRVHDRE